MKLVLDIDLKNSSPEKGDIIAFDGEKWVAQTHSEAFSSELKRIDELNNTIVDLKARIKTLEAHINTFAKAIKEK